MYSSGNKGTQGVQKASSKFSVLGPRTQGASVQKAKSMASRRDAKDREASNVTAFAASVANSVSSEEAGTNYPIRRARVFSDRTFDFAMSPWDVLTKLDQGLVEVSEAENAFLEDDRTAAMLQGLNNLQHSSQGYLLASAIATPTNHWLGFLPRSATGKIYYASPGEYQFGQLFDQDHAENWTAVMDRIIASPNDYSKLFAGFNENEYTIFNWNIGGHWGACLIHMEEDNNGRFTRVAQIGVMDPFQEQTTMVYVFQRMRAILEYIGCTILRGDIERTFWLPKQRDHYSCGLFTAYINRLLIERITDLYLPSGTQAYDESLWQPAREYFNPFQFQGELAGLCALQLMHRTGYNSRIVVAMVNRVTNAAVDPADAQAMAVGPDPTTLRIYGNRPSQPQNRPSLEYQQEQLAKVRVNVKRAARQEKRSRYGNLGGASPAKQGTKPRARAQAKAEAQAQPQQKEESFLEKLKKTRIVSVGGSFFKSASKKPAAPTLSGTTSITEAQKQGKIVKPRKRLTKQKKAPKKA